MTMTREDGFDAATFGYGPGLPNRWQAWGLCAAYSLINIVAAWLVAGRSPVGFAAIALAATFLFLATCARWTHAGRRHVPAAMPHNKEDE